MLKDISRAHIIGAWGGLMIVLGTCSIWAGAAVTASNGAFLLMTGLVPPAVMLLVFRGAPPMTVAEVLYSVDRSAKDDARSPTG
jgi:hypothetical protein